MKQYLDVVKHLLENGERRSNRTGVDTLFDHGLHLVFDMNDGFPAVTTKRLAWRSCFAEMFGFVKGLSNAADFRSLGTNVWNANANDNEEWLNNPSRKGEDDLGRIYGVQWRSWNNSIDQLRCVYYDLTCGCDNRREIITAWNPSELSAMALPPCHLLMQFGLRSKNILDLSVYIRSNDVGLGMPFNIAGYAWLLHVMAQITGHKPGKLHYLCWNYHIYINHIKALKEQLMRWPRELPKLEISSDISCLEELEQITDTDSAFKLINYNPHAAISMPMAV